MQQEVKDSNGSDLFDPEFFNVEHKPGCNHYSYRPWMCPCEEEKYNDWKGKQRG